MNKQGDNTKDIEKMQKEPISAESKEVGGRKKGLEPTRYGDWEKDGKCVDF